VIRKAGPHSLLVLVDYQERLMPSIDGADGVLADALFLGSVAKQLGVRVIGTEQNPSGLGPNVAPVRELCELTLQKMNFDACRDGLVRELGDARDVVIAGCEAHVCLMQTALGLVRARFDVSVVTSACGSRNPLDHAYAMRRLARGGATPVTLEMVVFEWLQTSEHPQFKAVLELLKQRNVAPPAP
jgi:nicotinamidase-related amidase